MLSLKQQVAAILGPDTRLSTLRMEGAGGQSGCSVMIAETPHNVSVIVKKYPRSNSTELDQELSSYYILAKLSNIPAVVRSIAYGAAVDDITEQPIRFAIYERAPGQTINDMLRTLGTLSRSHYWSVVMSILGGQVHGGERLYDGTRSLQRQSTSIKYSKNFCVNESTVRFYEGLYNGRKRKLTEAITTVAKDLARLHNASDREPTECEHCAVVDIKQRLSQWMLEIKSKYCLAYERAGLSAQRLEELYNTITRLNHSPCGLEHRCFVHGDASPGNFLWDPTQGVTMIDYGTVQRSVDAQGRPRGPAELDVAGFYERLRKYSAGFGVDNETICELQEAFWAAYRWHGRSLDSSAVLTCRLRIQMSRLWAAVMDADHASDQAGLNGPIRRRKLDHEWTRLQIMVQDNVPQQKRNILVLANVSGPGKGGLPVLNQEIVRALSMLEHISVTLFVVKLPHTDSERLHQQHGHAKIVCLAADDVKDPFELLRCAVKVHNPADLGLPPHEDQGQKDAPFDLIIGHSHYSSQAALLARQRWYPSAKLALMVHTSPLRKSDQAWHWYGKTRAQAFVEATRLAILEESTLPQADIVIGIGPLLTMEARERENLGQITRTRALEGGPRFHELIPGGYPSEVTYEKPYRTQREHFHLLLAGRATDPAKGLQHAIHAVQRLAASDPRITLHVLGVEQDLVSEWQSRMDKATGLPGLVRLHPFCDDAATIRHYYRAADLVIMPSTHEGFGMIFTEVASLGRPVLVTENSGAGQFALDTSRMPSHLGKAVVVRDELWYGDVSSPQSSRVCVWAESIDHVRQDPQKAIAVAAELQRVMRQYSWNDAARALLSAVFSASADAGDTVQIGKGHIRINPPRTESNLDSSITRASTTRNSTGQPDASEVEQVLASFPWVQSGISALEKFVSASLGEDVALRTRLGPAGIGYSGASVLYAYPYQAASRPHRRFQNGKRPGTKVKLVGVLKIFPRSLTNGIIEETSSLGWLKKSNLDRDTYPVAIAACRTQWAGAAAAAILYDPAVGVSLSEMMRRQGRLQPGPRRRAALVRLNMATIEVATLLARLHQQETSNDGVATYLDWYRGATRERLRLVLQKMGDVSSTFCTWLSRHIETLLYDSDAEVRSDAHVAPVHGDAHPSNFIINSTTKRVTMIDVVTLHSSLGRNGEVRGAIERDLGQFLHMLYRNGVSYGLSHEEIETCSQSFMSKYCATTTKSIRRKTLELFIACTSLVFFLIGLETAETAGAEALRQHMQVLEAVLSIGRWL